MPSYQYETVNVFTGERFGGNPLAVLTGCPRPDRRSDAGDRA